MEDKKFLVLGASGALGYAFTKELLGRQIKTRIFTRSRDKIIRLFGADCEDLIIDGDALHEQDVIAAAEGCDFIFHGINYPYQDWDPNMYHTTENVIKAAAQHHSAILFPGNIYSYGNTSEKITENSKPNAEGKKGLLRARLERRLNEATTKYDLSVLNIRLPDFWGPNVTNELIDGLFGNAVKGKTMQWYLRSDIPHQMVFTPDAAKAILALCEDNTISGYQVVNYGGHTFDSINELSSNISYEAQIKHHLKVVKKWMIKVGALFNPKIREFKEVLYQFENTILLDDSLFRDRFTEFSETEIQDAIRQTLEWFRENEKQS